MANRRMLSKSISTSKKVNSFLLKEMESQGKEMQFLSLLLYSWLHPHADDFGRLDGDPYWIKLNILPGIADCGLITEKEITDCLIAMNKVNLIHYYSIEGKNYIQIIDFEKHQVGLGKRTESKFPEFLGNS